MPPTEYGDESLLNDPVFMIYGGGIFIFGIILIVLFVFVH